MSSQHMSLYVLFCGLDDLSPCQPSLVGSWLLYPSFPSHLPTLDLYSLLQGFPKKPAPEMLKISVSTLVATLGAPKGPGTLY